MVDVPAKTEGDNSNAVAGYYISTTGARGAGPRRLDERRHGDAQPVQPAASQPDAAAGADHAVARQRAAAAGLSLKGARCRSARAPYSILMPAALITGAHLASSSLMNLAVR